jgi:hypothetical protein
MWLYEKLVNMYNIEDDNINTVYMISIATQTEKQNENEYGIDMESFNYNDTHFFKHLEFANQTYWEHFCDSMGYCFKSWKSGFYFFCHAIWPDMYITSGSKTIHNLSGIIQDKYKRRIKEILEKEQV